MNKLQGLDKLYKILGITREESKEAMDKLKGIVISDLTDDERASLEEIRVLVSKHINKYTHGIDIIGYRNGIVLCATHVKANDDLFESNLVDRDYYSAHLLTLLLRTTQELKDFYENEPSLPQT